MKFIQYKSKRLNGKKAWRFDVTIQGVRLRHGGFETKTDAEEAVAAIRLRARANKYGLVIKQPQITLQELIDARSKDPKIASQRATIPTLERFLKSVSGQIVVKELTKADLKTFLSDCASKGLQGRTVNRYLATVMACLNAAGEYFPELEDWTPPRIKRLKELPFRSRVLEQGEIAKLLAALRADRKKLERWKSARVKAEIYDLLRLMLLTGAREGELLKLRQTAFKPESRVLEIYASKTKTIRKIPVSDLVFQILEARQTGKAFFFSLTYDQLKKWLQKIGIGSGVTVGRDVAGGWVFYDLRHTAASVIEQAGIPYSTVSAILGHKRSDMTGRYTHATWQSMKNAVEVLETWCLEIDGFVEFLEVGGSLSVVSERKAS